MSPRFKISAILFVISTGVGFTSHAARADGPTPPAPSTQNVPSVVHYQYAPDVDPTDYQATPEQLATCEAKQHKINLKDVGLGEATLVYEDSKTAWNDGIKPAGEAVGDFASSLAHGVQKDFQTQIAAVVAAHPKWKFKAIVVGSGKGILLVGEQAGEYMVQGFGEVGKAFVQVGKGIKTAAKATGKYVAEPYKDHNYGHEGLVEISKTVGVGTYYLGDKVGHTVWHGLKDVGHFLANTTQVLAHHYQEPVKEQSESRTLSQCLAQSDDQDLDPDQQEIPDSAVNGALGVSSNTPVETVSPADLPAVGAQTAPASASPASYQADLPKI